MFGSTSLEIMIGLVFVFLLFSLMLTALQEAIEGIRRTRAKDLQRAIKELLGGNQELKGATGPSSTDQTAVNPLSDLYKHPLIYSLYQGEVAQDSARWIHKGPSYIPARNFSLAVIDLFQSGSTLSDNKSIATVYDLAVRVAGSDINRVCQEIEVWYNGAMDRAAGWYRRRTQLSLFVLGLLAAVALNINAITIARNLAVNGDMRRTLISMASNLEASRNSEAQGQASAGGERIPGFTKAQAEQLGTDLRDVGLPIGWGAATLTSTVERFHGWGPGWWYINLLPALEILLGFIATALAGMLGAPFWFDVLNKIMVIRSTVKPHEKSPEEASEDRQFGSTAPPYNSASSPVINTFAPANDRRVVSSDGPTRDREVPQPYVYG